MKSFYSVLFFFVLFVILPKTVIAQSTVLSYDNRGIYIDNINPSFKCIDSVRIRAFYTCTMITDTVSNVRGKEKMVLDVGKHIAKYYSNIYNEISYLLDNFHIIDVLSTLGYNKDHNTWYSSIYEATYFNMNEDRVTTTGRICATDYIYEEDIPVIDWNIEDSLKNIRGYTAQKATCFYKGRFYIAWFTSEIPVPYGPWEFHGLSGLIVSVSDEDKYYTFDLESVTVLKGVPVTFPEYKYLKTTRQKYMNMRKQIEADFNYYNQYYGAQSSFSVIMPEGYQPKRLGNDFIELE